MTIFRAAKVDHFSSRHGANAQLTPSNDPCKPLRGSNGSFDLDRTCRSTRALDYQAAMERTWTSCNVPEMTLAKSVF